VELKIKKSKYFFSHKCSWHSCQSPCRIPAKY